MTVRIRRPAIYVAAWMLLGTFFIAACEKKAIPPRNDGLSGGTLVFEESFDKAAFADTWTITPGGDWKVVDGWAHSKSARNKGLWLTGFELPEAVRIEFDVRSEPRGKKRFEGDAKCEVFCTEPAHEKGYILINGGWNNQLDIIARLDEHGKDRKETASRPVEKSKVYRWTIIRTAGTILWFRDGERFMTYEDKAPVKGRYFGFNNWEAHLYFDNLKIYKL